MLFITDFQNLYVFYDQMTFILIGVVDTEIGGDDMPYTTLTYGNGQQQRRNLTGIDTSKYSYTDPFKML